MKKVIYTVSIFISMLSSAKAQDAIKETREAIADVMLFQKNWLLYTQKEEEGQFIYAEKLHTPGVANKVAALNAGHTNTLIGSNPDLQEVFVYQKGGRKKDKIAFYTRKKDEFEKTGERKMPKLRNHSYNLGLFLSEDKNTMIISADMAKSKGYDDLYLSKWENGKWTKPKNLGNQVNTREAEFAPFVSNDTLYFARKSGQESYIYAVPFDGTAPSSSPVKLANAINQTPAYNAYYKKTGKMELWISATIENGEKSTYTAYMTSPTDPEKKEVAAQVPVAKAKEETAKSAARAEEKQQEAPQPIKALTPDFSFAYSTNEVYPSDMELKGLHQFLNQQQEGSSIKITGYSDGAGTEKAKQNVSKKRAAYLKWYIDKYYSDKKFSTSIESKILAEVGEEARKTELFVQ